MKTCIPKGGTIAVSHQDTYIALMILYNEHIKLDGDIVRYSKEQLTTELLNYLYEPLYMDEILNVLLFDKHIQENSPTEFTSETTYSITIKGAAEFQKYKGYKPYLDCMAKAKEMYGKEISESDFFQMGGEFRGLQSSLAHAFYADFLEYLEDQKMFRELGLIL